MKEKEKEEKGLRNSSERKRAEDEGERFIRQVSHDLRSPLMVLAGASQMLMTFLHQQGMEREAALARIVLRSARTVEAMIQELQEAVSLSPAQLQLEPLRTDLIRFLEELLERLVPPEDRKRLRFEPVGVIPEVNCDAAHLERALAKLVTNALRSSDPNAPVAVRVAQVGNEVVVSVIDRGPGIPAQELPQLFERSHRAPIGRPAVGLGLGLYISRLIVEAHGGRIWVESESGKGSIFGFALPITVP